MTDWKRVEEIYRKLVEEEDITWQESDVIYRIAHDFLFKNRCEDAEAFLKKWYTAVLDKVISGKKGVYLHSLPIKPRWRFLMESRPTEVTELCDRILSTAIMLKLLDEAERVTIATFRSEEDVKNLLKGKARQDIIGRKYKGFDYYIDRPFSTRKLVNLRTTDGYKKYLFEIYRPLTLRRIGLDRLTKIDIRDGTLAGACAHYGKNDIVFDTQDVYERTIEILLDMNVPIYTCSTDFPREIETAEFDMFVDEKYAEPVKRVLRTVHETDFKRFFGRCYKYDEDFSDVIRYIANEILFWKAKEDDIEDDGWVDIIR